MYHHMDVLGNVLSLHWNAGTAVQHSTVQCVKMITRNLTSNSYALNEWHTVHWHWHRRRRGSESLSTILVVWINRKDHEDWHWHWLTTGSHGISPYFGSTDHMSAVRPNNPSIGTEPCVFDSFDILLQCGGRCDGERPSSIAHHPSSITYCTVQYCTFTKFTDTNHNCFNRRSRSAACSSEVEIASTPGTNADYGTLTLLQSAFPAFPAWTKKNNMDCPRIREVGAKSKNDRVGKNKPAVLMKIACILSNECKTSLLSTNRS